MDALCTDCQVDTLRYEYYGVYEEVWLLATKDKPAVYLCIGCLEQRIKRKLGPEDFSLVPLNFMVSDKGNNSSQRLLDRMGGKFQKEETIQAYCNSLR